MTYTLLISPIELIQHLDDPDWVIVDCRASLVGPENAQRAYLQSHIPGAAFANLEHDLSAPMIRGNTGRHPLPEPEEAASLFSCLGIGPGVQVVAYDDAGGALAAGRLWWMLRWLGHTDAAVLDGGWQAWLRDGLPVRAGKESRPAADFQARLRPELTATVDEIELLRSDPAAVLVDARSSDRFHGLNETLDPVAGHIPGAVSLPYPDNLDSSGRFRSKEELRRIYLAKLGNIPAGKVVVYCGSGVTAAHDLLAMMAAGLGEARLYPGSWSEWITDPKRPVARD